jgi:hypothetical protein
MTRTRCFSSTLNCDFLQPERLADPEGAKIENADQRPLSQAEITLVDLVSPARPLFEDAEDGLGRVVFFDVFESTPGFWFRSSGVV